MGMKVVFPSMLEFSCDLCDTTTQATTLPDGWVNVVVNDSKRFLVCPQSVALPIETLLKEA